MFPANATASNTAECEVAPIEADNKVVVDDPNEIVKNPINDMEATKVPAVGFMVTGWAGGVSFLSSLPNIPYEVSMIVDIVNSFLLTSPLVPYDSTTHTGFWRILTIRTSRRTKECMIIIQHNNPPSEITPLAAIPAHSSYDSGHVTKETEALVDGNTIFAKERDRLVSLLVNADLLTSPSEAALPPITIKVTSIFFQEFSGLSNPPPEHPVQVRIIVNADINFSPTVQHASYKSLFPSSHLLLACLWSNVPHRTVRRLQISNIAWSILPSEYGRCRNSV
jgi:hypothetical protein